MNTVSPINTALKVCFINILWLFCRSSEFQKLWRSVPVDSIDDDKIEDYLKRQGISSMKDTGPKKIVRLHHIHMSLTFNLYLNYYSTAITVPAVAIETLSG